MRCFYVLVLSLALTGCSGALPNSAPDATSEAKGKNGFLAGLMGGGTAAAPGKPAKPKPPLARAKLAGGDVVVAGPDGYCIDPVTAETSRERGFALIASCHILSGGKVGSSVEPVLVTVTVGPKGKVADIPTPQQMSTTTRAELLGGETGDGFVVANLNSGGDALLENGDKRHWRGAFVQGDRLVGLALYAPEGSAYAGSHGGGFLRKVYAKIAAQSPGGTVAATTASKKPSEEGLLGRLFNR